MKYTEIENRNGSSKYLFYSYDNRLLATCDNDVLHINTKVTNEELIEIVKIAIPNNSKNIL